MKHFLLVSTMLVTASFAQFAASVPWQETFDDGDSLAAFTVLDSNADGTYWEWDKNYYCARISYNDDEAMDDWLITPAFTLQAGGVYKFSIDARMTFSTEKFEVFAGQAPTADAMTVEVIPQTTVKTSTFVTYSGEFTATQSSTWYVGIHGCSAADQLYLYVDNLSLVNGVTIDSPAAVDNLAVIPDATGLASVAISATLPTTTSSGSALVSISKVEIICDNDVVKTLEGLAPGDLLSWTHNDAPLGSHTYKVVVYNGDSRGQEAEATVFVGPNIPSKVPYLAVGEFTPGNVTVRWRAPEIDVDGNALNAALVTYKVVYYEVMEGSYYYAEDIEDAENLTGTEYVHHAIDADAGQKFTAYGVYAKTSAGTSQVAQTPLFPVGTPYTTPYVESFAQGKASSLYRSESVVNYATVPSWDPILDSVSELTARDNDGGFLVMTGEYADDCARFYTGKISLEGLTAPVLSFYVYNFSNGSENPDRNELGVYVSDGTQFVLQQEFAMNDLPELGWNKVVVPLTDYIGKTVQIALMGTMSNNVSTAVDALFVGELASADIEMMSIKTAEKLVAGNNFNVTVRFENEGAADATDYSVELYRNGVLAQTVAGPALSTGEIGDVTFTESVSVLNVENLEYQARINYAADVVDDNNASEKVTVAVSAPNHPAPTGLSGVLNGSNVSLNWSTPDVDSAAPGEITDDFESYESYATENIGDWTMVDADQKQVGKLDLMIPGIHYEGSTQSFWVMDATAEGANSLYAAHSGINYLAQIFNYDRSACDDWAISPELYPEAQTISFFAKGYSSTMTENMEVLYSTSGRETSDFTLLLKADVTNVWTQYSVDLPAGSKFFAIRCTTEDGFMLFVDDVTYTPLHGGEPIELLGYNVYRNGERLNDAPVAETNYVDKAPQAQSYEYRVTAVYNRGESLPSDSFVADLSGLNVVGRDAAVKFTATTGTIIVSGCAGTSVSIFAADGKSVAAKATAQAVEHFAVAPGIYIVKAGDVVAKVVVK